MTLREILMATPLLLALAQVASGQEAKPQAPHLSEDGTLADILNNPAFTGFAARILPWDDRAYDPAMPLAQIGRLLPYHSAVDTGTVTRALNRMIDDTNAGLTVFYDIYPEGHLSRPLTGLFFYRGTPGAPFAVIAPGGGFAYVGSVHEGFPYAQEISATGMNAFVLKYRAGQGARPATEDLAIALDWIIDNAAVLEVAPTGYSLWGSSAGARMVAAIGSHGAAAFGGADLPKPAAVIMAYTSHQDHAEAEPPTFVVVGAQDGIAPPENMERRIAALRRIGTAVEYHRYPNLGHGFGTGTGTSAAGWILDAVRFWRRQL